MPIDPTAVAVASRSFSRNPILRQELLDRYPGSWFNDEGAAVLSGDRIIRFLRGAGKAITGLDVLDEAVFRAVPELRLVSKYGVGLDMIDLDAARRHGVSVRWTPGVNRQAVAELAVCFMIALCRGVVSLAQDLAAARTSEDATRTAMEREVAALRDELEAAEAGLAALSGEQDGEDAAQDWNLAGLTVLYVGGRSHHIARLRAVVERASGQFLHHDGGIEERSELLPGLVSRADLAACPIDCVSHTAALVVKRLCRQAGKPFLPLRSSGVTSLLRAITSTEVKTSVSRAA